jgi:hypothetical protein
MNRYKKHGGWYNESHRHYLAAKGIKTRHKYYYTPTYVPADLSLIGADAIGTAGAAAVPWLFPALAAFAVYKGVEHVKRKKDKTGSYFIRKERHRPGKIGQVNGVPIYASKIEEGHIYPVSPEQVKVHLQNMPKEDLRGLKAIEFDNPRGEQKDAWGQYVRSKRTIKIFSQPYAYGKIDGMDPVKVNQHMRSYVLKHENGHHIALSQRNITDSDIGLAEARADAYAAGLDVEDRDVMMLQKR